MFNDLSDNQNQSHLKVFTCIDLWSHIKEKVVDCTPDLGWCDLFKTTSDVCDHVGNIDVHKFIDARLPKPKDVLDGIAIGRVRRVEQNRVVVLFRKLLNFILVDRSVVHDEDNVVVLDSEQVHQLPQIRLEYVAGDCSVEEAAMLLSCDADGTDAAQVETSEGLCSDVLFSLLSPLSRPDISNAPMRLIDEHDLEPASDVLVELNPSGNPQLLVLWRI